MTITKASGQCFLMFSPTVLITPALVAIRSSRLMPGLRGMPAVTITTVGAGERLGVVVGAGDAAR